VGVPEFESGTSSLSATRSNQLSYTPEFAKGMSDLPVRFDRLLKFNILGNDGNLSNGVRGIRPKFPLKG
jgi:hypothetical protein